MRAALEQPDRRVSIADTLIPELLSPCSPRRSELPPALLVDEISQYVGNSKEILLNIQSIVERISKDCNNQVWLACTAQQSLMRSQSMSTVRATLTRPLGKFGSI